MGQAKVWSPMEEFRKGTQVIVKKLHPAPNPSAPTPLAETYKEGVENPGLSIPILFEVEGCLTTDLQIGAPLLMNRHRRNNTLCQGSMETSPICEIHLGYPFSYFQTANSFYEIRRTEP